jgi:hypothetical protein
LTVPAAINCPYCQTPITASVLVCAACQRDVGVLVPLLNRMGALEAQLDALQARLTAADATRKTEENGMGLQPQAPSETAAPPRWRALIMYALLGYLGVVALHGLLVFMLDTSALVLRLSTIVLPMVLAAIANREATLRFGDSAMVGAVLALCAVATMLGVTATIDDVPWWPQTARDRSESIEYAVAMALAWASGHLAGGAVGRVTVLRHAPVAASGALASRRARLLAAYGRMQRVAASVAPILSAAMAIYTGLKSLR